MAYVEGDIVQITDEKHHWFPCLIVVTEDKGWGVMGYITIPRNDGEPCGNAFIRLSNEQIEVVGKAALVRSNA